MGDTMRLDSSGIFPNIVSHSPQFIQLSQKDGWASCQLASYGQSTTAAKT